VSTPAYSQQVRDAIIAAYYPRLTAAPDSVRTRAQAAYAVSSTVAAAIVGAGLIVNLSEVPGYLKILGLVSFMVWLVTAGLYVTAVGSRVADVPPGSVTGPDQLVDAALKAARAEKEIIERRLRRANIAAMAAAMLTAATFAVTVVVEARSNTAFGRLVVETNGARILSRECGNTISTLFGEISLKSLNAPFVEVMPTRASCPLLRQVLIPRNLVLAVEYPRS
jgi:hypothetical protein